MNKTIGHVLTIKQVRGFEDARGWIYRLISDGLVKCSQCQQAATHVFWQDQAEWYCHCNEHREEGRQWTGSTRWNPSSFSISVLKEPADAWLSRLAFDERKRFKLESFDATDYYALMPEDMPYVRHYFVGGADTIGAVVYVDVHPLTNGEYAYQLTRGQQGVNANGRFYCEALTGAWPTEAEALDAARKDMEGRRHV